MRLTIPFVSFTAMVLLAAQTVSVPAWADPTPRDIKCQWKKHRKAGRYQACVQNAVVEKVQSPDFNLVAAKVACWATFETAWELQDANAAALGEVCLDGAGNFDEVRAMLDRPADRLEAWLAGTRWVNNGDGTATDSTTGLQWELKTDDGSVHDKDNVYGWTNAVCSMSTGATTFDSANGSAFTDFISRLNGSADGVCFAGHCDWRLPTLPELQGIVDPSAPGCGVLFVPCTTIPGFTVTNAFYYSSSTNADSPQFAWSVIFAAGLNTFADSKYQTNRYVRAVRGGS